jgi:hypothetical protein
MTVEQAIEELKGVIDRLGLGENDPIVIVITTLEKLLQDRE